MSRLSLSLVLALSLPSVLCAEEPNAKAARLLEPLARRPGTAVLFERFVNAWLDTGSLESLREFLAKRAAADPSPGNRLLLAQYYIRQGEPVRALEQLRAALAADAGGAETWLLKGQTEARMLDFTAAAESLKKCLAAHPPEELAGRAAQLLGRVQARAGQTDAALATWGALMKSRPADEDLREDILEIQIAESLWPAALENAAHLAEHTADPYKKVIRRMRLGDVQDRSGQRDKALETFAACLADAGAGSWLEKEILAQIDKLFRREDDLSGLQAFLEKQSAEAPQRAGVQRALAKLLLETGETDAALAAAKRLMDLMPGDRTVREEFIAMLTGAGRAAEAIPQVQQLMAASPNDAELRLVLAGLHHEVKDEVAALAAVREFEKLAAADAGTPVRAATLLDKFGQTAEAVQSLRAALERDKARGELRQLLAALLHKSGDKAAAISEWTALAASGDLPAALQAVRAMQAAGETEAAWSLLMQCVPRGKDDVIFLTQIAALADTEPRAREALPVVRALVDRAKSAPDLDAALEAVLRVARKAAAVPALTQELRAAATAQQWCLLAALLESERDTAGAAAALEKAKALNAALALSQSVRLRTLRGDFAAAALAAEEMFAQSPTVAAAEAITSLRRRAGNLAGALRWVQEWKKLAPGSAAPALEEAALLQSAGRDAEAIAALRTAAGRMEQNADIRSRLAAAYAAAGQPAEAMRLYAALYEEAADLPAKMRWLQPWAEAARGAGQLEELIAQFEERRRDNRTSTAPLMALGELHRMADNYEERRKALTEAQRLKPDDADIILEIARLEEREGRRAEAIATLRAALPKDKAGRLAQALSEMLIAAGENDEGLALLSSGTLTPQQVEAAVDRLRRAGNTRQALQFLEPFLSQWPQEWGLQIRYVHLLGSAGQAAAAVRRCYDLLAMQPLAAVQGSPPPVLDFSHLLISRVPSDCAALLRMIRMQGNQRSRRVFANIPLLNRAFLADLGQMGPEDVPLFAAQFIAQELGGLPKDAAAEAQVKLSEYNFSCALILPLLGDVRDLFPREHTPDLRPALKDLPADRAVQMYVTLHNTFGSWITQPDAKLAQQTWESLHKEAAEAALFFSLPAAASAKTDDAWAAARLAELEAWPAPTPLLTMAALRAAGLDYSSPPPARERMIALLMRWRALELQAAPGFAAEVRVSVFTALSREFLRTKNLPALRELLNHEWRTGSGPLLLAAAMTGSLAQPLGFPPEGLAGVPELVTAFLKEDDLPAVAAELAKLVEAPALRLLLLGKSPDGAPAEGVAALIAENPGEAAPLILAASLAERRDDYAAAADYVVKAQFLPMHPVMRRQLDSALAWWAQRAAKEGDALYLAGREAALRLRRDAADPDDRTELATIIDTLGLTEEADRLMQQGKALTAGSSGNPLERAEKLLREGRTKEALPVLLQQMRGYAVRWMTTQENFYDEDELEHWRTLAQTAGLMPEVERAFQPENPTPRQLAEYAALCDLTLRWPEAITAAARAAAAPGAGWEVRWRHLHLQLLAEPDKAAAHVLASSLEWNEQLLDACQETIMDNSTLENAVRFARMVDGMLQAAPERAGRDFPVKDVLNAIGTSTTSGRFYSVPNIIAKQPPEITTALPVPMPAGETERVLALIKDRAALYESVGRRLLVWPGIGLAAWEQLRHIVEPETILTEGMAAAADLLQTKNLGPIYQSNSFMALMDEMALHSVRAGRTKEFEAIVLEAWKLSEWKDAQERLSIVWPLHACSDPEFPSVAGEHLKESNSSWELLAKLVGMRESGRELLPVFREAALSEKERNHALEEAPIWMKLMTKMEGPGVAQEFMRAVFKTVARRAAAEAQIQGGDDEGRPGPLLQIIGSCSQVPELLPPLLPVLRDFLVSGLTRDETIMLPAFLEDTILTNSLNEALRSGDFSRLKTCLDTLQLNGAPSDLWLAGSFLFHSADKLMALPEKDKAALGFGGPVEKLGFGWQMMAAVSDKRMDFWGMLARWQPQIAAMPEGARGHLEQLLRDYGDGYAAVTEEGEQFRRWVFRSTVEEETEELADSIAEFLRDAAAGEMEDADTLQSQVNGVVDSAVLTTPEKMQEVLDKACGIAAKFGTVDALSAVTGSIIESVENTEVDTAQAAWRLGLVAQAVQRGMHDRYLFSYRLNQAGRKLMQGADDSLEGRLAKFVQHAAPQLTQPSRVWLLGPLLEVEGDGTALTDDEATARSLRWVAQHRAENPAFFADMETALLIARDVLEWDGAANAAEAELSPGLQRLLALLRSDDTPLGVRLHAGVNYLELLGEDTPKVLAEEGARLLLRAHREKLPVHRDAESSVCVALAALPDELRDAALIKDLLPHLQIARPREEITDYTVLAGMNALLDLTLPLGEAAATDRLLEAEGHFPNSITLGVLARRGDKSRLAALMARLPDVHRRDSGWGMNTDALLQTQLPAVAAEAASSDARMELLAMFAALNNPRKTEGLRPQAESIAALAPDVAAHTWRDPSAKDRALFTLLQHGPQPALAPALEEMASRVPLSSIAGFQETSMQSVTPVHLYCTLHAARLEAALAQGNLEPLREAFAVLKTNPLTEQGWGNQIAGQLLDSARSAVLRHWPALTPPQRVALCESWRVFAEAALFPPASHTQSAVRTGLLLHLLTGQEAAWQDWQKSLTDTQRAEVLHSTAFDGDIPAELRLPDDFKGTEEERLRVLAGVLAFYAPHADFFELPPLDALYFDWSSGTREEFLELEPALSAALPGDSWAAFAFARCLATMDRWPEVLARTEKAMTTLVSGDGAWMPLLELHLQALDKTGRGAEQAAWREKIMGPAPVKASTRAAVIRGACHRLGL